jgi:hypothetical protein
MVALLIDGEPLAPANVDFAPNRQSCRTTGNHWRRLRQRSRLEIASASDVAGGPVWEIPAALAWSPADRAASSGRSGTKRNTGP